MQGVSDRTARRLAWGAFALYVVLFLAGAVFELVKRPTPAHGYVQAVDVMFAISTTAFPIVAISILTR